MVELIECPGPQCRPHVSVEVSRRASAGFVAWLHIERSFSPEVGMHAANLSDHDHGPRHIRV